MWLRNASITKPAFSYSQAILSEILGWRKGQCWWFFQWWAYLESRTPLPLLALCPTTPIHPSLLGRLREHFPRLFSLLVAGNTQHTQLNVKHGINSMACDLYAKCHMLHLHETEQETGLFFFTMSSCHKWNLAQKAPLTRDYGSTCLIPFPLPACSHPRLPGETRGCGR